MLFFNYNCTLRFLLLHKLPLVKNIFVLPCLRNLICFFSIKGLEDLSDVRIYNYFYFFKFFFGHKAFFFSYKVNLGFGKTTYDFTIQIALNKHDLFRNFFFISSDIIYCVDYNYMDYCFYKASFFVFFIVIKDMNIFSEKKTNLGLFNLKNYLNVKVSISASDSDAARLLLNVFKIYFII